MMTFEKVVLDESPALHAKPGNFQRKLTRMTLKATCEPTTPSFIAHKLSKNFVSFLVLLLFSWFCCVTFCLMGLSFWNKGLDGFEFYFIPLKLLTEHWFLHTLVLSSILIILYADSICLFRCCF